MLKITMKKTIAILMLIITLLSVSNNVWAATAINEAFINHRGDCGIHMQYFYEDETKTEWVNLYSDYVVYEENGKEYPAYCLNREKHGVGSVDPYTVDISSVIDDVRVWRVIINGFPYKTPAQMGVADKYDAFMVTKQAVYCILYNFNENTRYKALDSRGTAMISAIKNLVNIGRNGTQTPYTAGVAVSEVGQFIEDGDYYTQEYQIKCGIQVSQYTITATAGLPTGSKITNMSNVERTTFGANEHFKVKVPKGQLDKDVNAIFSIQAKCTTYPVFYGRTRIPGTQNYAVTYDPLGDITGKSLFSVKADTGKIQIIKNDAETDLPIEGVTFVLSKTDGTVLGNATTDENGIATFTSLYQGDYILKETSTNDKYILNETEFNVNVEFNKITTETITNEHKRGNLRICKVDKDNNNISLGNVEFQLYSEEFEKVIGTYRTDVNGEIFIENLRIGNYQLIETETNKWYNLADNSDFEIKWDEETTGNIENELKKGQVKIIKIDKENPEAKLEGVEFEILNEKDEVLEKITTNEKGEALTSKYPIRDYKNIKIRESKTLDNYVLSDEVKEIELIENELIEVTFENEKIKGNVEITKVDSKDENEKLEGAKFGLYDENDKLVQTLETSKEGKATSQDLYKGKYYLKELETGSIYYLLNEQKYDFEIVNHKEIVPITITNEEIDIKVNVEKTGPVEIQAGKDVNYTFSNVSNESNTYLDSFKWYDFIPTDYIRLQKMTTGTWNEDLTYSVYYKTNKSNDYILFKDNLKSTENNTLDFTTIKLNADEYITETMYDFGKVQEGFREVETPTMNCKSLNNLKDGQTFTNNTKTVGIHNLVTNENIASENLTSEANSKWTTVVHNLKGNHEIKLPKTGK